MVQILSVLFTYSFELWCKFCTVIPANNLQVLYMKTCYKIFLSSSKFYINLHHLVISPKRFLCSYLSTTDYNLRVYLSQPQFAIITSLRRLEKQEEAKCSTVVIKSVICMGFTATILLMLSSCISIYSHYRYLREDFRVQGSFFRFSPWTMDIDGCFQRTNVII